MNLLTMIPIIDEMGETTHFVGFQVDLVEKPEAVTKKNPSAFLPVNFLLKDSSS